MLVLAAIIYAGTWSSSAGQARGSFPQSRPGTVVGTRVTVDRRFPPAIPEHNAVRSLQRAEELNKEQQDACSRLKLHRLQQNGVPSVQLTRCQAVAGRTP